MTDNRYFERVTLVDLRNALQERMNYDNPKYAFDILLNGFYRSQRRSYYAAFVKKRGYMSLKDAVNFQNYVGYKLV